MGTWEAWLCPRRLPTAPTEAGRPLACTRCAEGPSEALRRVGGLRVLPTTDGPSRLWHSLKHLGTASLRAFADVSFSLVPSVLGSSDFSDGRLFRFPRSSSSSQQILHDFLLLIGKGEDYAQALGVAN